MVGLKEILNAGIGNIAKGRASAAYWDELLSLRTPPAEAHAKMLKAYLENEAFLHTMNRFYMAILLGKYLDRVTESREQANEESLFEDFQDMFRFAKYFSGNIAAAESLPEYKVIIGAMKIFVGMVEH